LNRQEPVSGENISSLNRLRIWYNFFMDKIAIDGPKPPIGFLPSLWKGIEFVNANPVILVIPVLIDAFLWLGPHLTVIPLVNPILDDIGALWAANQASPTMIDGLRQAAGSYNLFSLFAFIPLFPPSLMAGAASGNILLAFFPLFPPSLIAGAANASTPLGFPIAIVIANWWECLGLAPLLIAGSVPVGSFYWVLAGRWMQAGKWTLRDWFGRWARTVLAMVLLCGGFLICLLVIFVPAVLVIDLIGLISLDIAGIFFELLTFFGGGFLFWVFLFVMFSIHGIILFRDGILQSIRNSVFTSRWLYPLSIWIPMFLILLQFLASWVWSRSAYGNWTGAVGILGNAYTSSVIVTASMAYYIDKRRWISEIQSYLQSRTAVKPPATGV
jgi:hypothetical protein